MKNIILIGAALLLSGCGAYHDLQDAKAAKTRYIACLEANPKKPEECKREKELYEARGLAYENLAPSRD